MGLQSERDELQEAWRSLGGQKSKDGWHTISIATGNACDLRAGRFHPGDSEALLVGFGDEIVLPSADQLPKGQGFDVCPVVAVDSQLKEQWIALRRQPAGSIDLFTMMAVDVISTLADLKGTQDKSVLHAFLLRIRAWQDFMRRNSHGILSFEAEVGLLGELEVLRLLMRTGISPLACVQGWTGPENGLHDFQLGTGSIEVKSTLCTGEFPALIGSLQQLDNTLVKPLFLAGVRLVLEESGISLTETICDIRDALSEDSFALSVFNSHLLHAGYFDVHAEQYLRRYSLNEIRLLKVSEKFPRLTRAMVPLSIRQVQYELDLDLILDMGMAPQSVIADLGVN